MWAQRDEFQFVWKRLTGDFILQARVELRRRGRRSAPQGRLDRSGQPSTPTRRTSTRVVHGDGLTSLQFRRRRARSPSRVESRDHRARTSSSSSGAARPTSCRRAKFGEPFTTRRSPTSTLRDDVVRRAVRSARTTRRRRARRSSATSASSAGDGRLRAVSRLPRQRARDPRRARPARGRRSISTDGSPFQAPNWTRDGKALIYTPAQRDGCASVRFDLATRQPTAINTGFATRNNNDHVLSFDGTMLGISDHAARRQRRVDRLHGAGRRRHAEAHHARSAVVPARLVARRQVARLHRRQRNGEFDIYTHRRRRRRRGERPDATPRGSTTGRSTRRTASTSISTRRAAGRCRSGG